jgi:hypothetical protein
MVALGPAKDGGVYIFYTPTYTLWCPLIRRFRGYIALVYVFVFS